MRDCVCLCVLLLFLSVGNVHVECIYYYHNHSSSAVLSSIVYKWFYFDTSCCSMAHKWFARIVMASAWVVSFMGLLQLTSDVKILIVFAVPLVVLAPMTLV